jgi:predicted tellurium resistance membrane protein TerC
MSEHFVILPIIMQAFVAIILMFIGTKMCISGYYHVPVEVTMGFIFFVLVGSMVVSLYKKRKV